jgi:hypothetical protein
MTIDDEGSFYEALVERLASRTPCSATTMTSPPFAADPGRLSDGGPGAESPAIASGETGAGVRI